MEEEVKAAVEMDQNALVSWYLITSYAYYELGHSLVSDHFFDDLCAQLHREWDGITHPHKALLTRDEVLVTGAFVKFPKIVVKIATRLT